MKIEINTLIGPLRDGRALMNQKCFPTTSWSRFDALTFFNQIMDFFFKLLIFFVVLVLGMGLARLFWEVWKIMALSELKEAFSFTVTNLLTFFVLLELFKSLVEYFREHRLKLTFIIDATLVFILREVMIGLYQHQSAPLQIAALALLALVLGTVRTLAIIYSPMERRMVATLKRRAAEIPRSGGQSTKSQTPDAVTAPVH